MADVENYPAPDKVLDATDLICPEPIMMLHNAVNDVVSGEVIEMVATDPSTLRDVPKFCEFLGHQLIGSSETGQVFRFFIRKGE